MPVPKNNAGAAGAAYEIRDASLGAVQEKAFLPIAPNVPFFLAHYPENWRVGTVDGEPYWLPELQRDWILAGANGKRTLRKGDRPEAAYDASHLKMTRNGAVLLDPSIVVECDGQSMAGYLREIECKDPKTGRVGKFYLDRFETPKTPRPGRRLKFNRDRELENRWLLALVEQGFVNPPNPDVVDERIARAVYHVERNQNKVQLPEESRKRLVDAAESKLDKTEAAAIPSKTADGVAKKKAAPKKKAPARRRRSTKKADEGSTDGQ